LADPGKQAIVIRKGQTRRANDSRATVRQCGTLCERDHIAAGGVARESVTRHQSSSDKANGSRPAGYPAFAGHDGHVRTRSRVHAWKHCRL